MHLRHLTSCALQATISASSRHLRIALSLFTLGCLAPQVFAAASSQLSAAVGQQSQPIAITLILTASGTAAAPQAVTQGVPAMDFVVSGGTCAANTAYTIGQQCTVNVIFAPKYPGLRFGAVLLTSTTGTPLATTLVTGNASGALSVFNPGRISTLAGDGELNYRADNVLATQAPIFLPYGVAVDPRGNLYLSDTNNNRIRRVDAQSGLISTIAGSGVAGYSGDGGPATQAEVNQPGGLAIDGTGSLYVADSGNDIVRRIDAVTGVITTVAGIPFTQGYTGDGSAAISATLASPRGIAFDASANLYIADTSNNVIRKIDASTAIITTVAGNGIAGYNGDNLQATTAQLNSPWTVALAADNSLYIADLANNRVRKVASGIVSTVAGTGSRGFTGDGSSATSAQLDNPTSVVLDPGANLYIADSGNNRIRKVYAASGKIQTLTGNDSEQFAGDGGPATQASLYAPYALFFDQAGSLYIADTLHNRIRLILATPVAIAYPVMRVGKTSSPQLQGLENDGNAALSLTAPVFSNAALDSSTTSCSFTAALAPTAACVLGVQFAPTTVGSSISGTVTLTSNAGNSPAILNLSGQVLSVEPTTTALASTVNPSLVTQAITLAATVASADPSRSGPVTFLDGATVLCANVQLASGTANCVVPSLTLGQHSLTASYAGDDNNAASVSPALIQVVKQQPTLTLAVSPNPAEVTQSVTFSLTATATTGTPSGSVVVYDGGTALSGNITISTSGSATYSTSQLTPGQHNLSVQYTGDSSNASAQSNIVAETVNQGTSITTLSTNNASANVGTPVVLSATVSSPGVPTSTGTVQFAEGSTILGTATLDANAHATLTLSNLAPGPHTLIATYSGDTDTAPSTSTSLLQAVQQIATTTALASDTTQASAGATIHLTATVAISGNASPDGPITGLVTFTEGATILGTAQLNPSGLATIAVSTLTVGSHSIVASYPGNTNYATSASNALLQSIASTASTAVLTASAANSLAGKPVTFTVTLTSPTGTPTGNVIFRDGSASIGQQTLNPQGVATFTSTTLAVGAHSITAAYQGDGSYLPSTSSQVTDSVSLATTALTLAGPTAAVNVGTAALFTAALTGNGIAPTGPLTLFDGTAAIATQNVTNTGTFSFNISTLAVGTHTLTASYAGDASNAPASSSAISVTVQQAPTSTNLSTAANPSPVNRPLTLTASVTSVGTNLTGSIAFLDGANTLGSAPLNGSGTVALTISAGALAPGTHTLTAVYSGDTNHTGSTSPALAQLVVQVDTLSLATSSTPSTSGNPVTFTARVQVAGAPVPTGSISFADGTTTIATQPLDATGAATFQIATLAVGSHTIAVHYSGDTSYQSADASLIQTVQSANTQVALASSANPAIYAARLSLIATVTSNGGIATGAVQFTDAGVAIGTATLNASGIATLDTSTLAPGNHSIVANYLGDGRASASTSVPLALSVRQTTSLALTSSANPTSTLTSISLTALVTNAGATPLTGTVTFTDGAATVGTTPIDATGHATITLPSLTSGAHSLVAAYIGDLNDFPATSTVFTETVQLRPTTTALTASSTAPSNPQQVTLIGIVRWTGPAPPSGTVTFTNGTVTVGTTPIDASGAATINIQVDPGITENIVATYNGDASYATSGSPVTAVTGGPATQFNLALSSAAVTVQTTQHVVVEITLDSIKSFADTMQFGCLGLPYAATCTFSSPQSALAANGTATAQLTIDTGDPLGAGTKASLERTHTPAALFALLPAGAITALALFFRRRIPLRGLLLLLCAVAATLSATGCAGLQTSGTPPGTYTFKVTASGLGTGVTQSKSITLTVTQ